VKRIDVERARAMVDARAKTHGNRHHMHSAVALAWSGVVSAAVGHEVLISKREVLLMLTTFKILRMVGSGTTFHEDDFVDAFNYLEFAYEGETMEDDDEQHRPASYPELEPVKLVEEGHEHEAFRKNNA